MDQIMGLVIGSLIIYVYFRVIKYGKYAFVHMGLSIPMLCFSTNMINNAMTVDEWNYINAFMKMNEVHRGSLHWIKGTYQYRISEIFSGTACRILNSICGIEDKYLIIFYKYTHWFMYFIIAILIAYIWNKIYEFDKYNSMQYRFVNSVTLWILISMPLACLLLKVCNYDAGCIYFGIASLSLIILADKKYDTKLAVLSCFVALGSCLEKWGGLPYWCVCVAAMGAICLKEKKKLKAICLEIGVVVASGIICYISLIYIRILENSGIVDINIGAALFPIFFMGKAFFDLDSAVNFEDIRFYDAMAFKYLIFITVCIIVFSFVLFKGREVYWRLKIIVKNKYVYVILLSFLLVAGIVVTFGVIRYQYPFVEIPSGYYIPNASMNGTTYFYNSRTRIGYIACQCLYPISVILTNMPTSILILLVLTLVTKIVYRDISRENDYYVFLTELLVIFLPIAYSLAGDPAVPRYFGVTILMLPILALYRYSRNYIMSIPARFEPSTDKKSFGKVVVILYILFVFEMLTYVPNYTSFAPMWVYKNNNFKTNIRQGEWASGEAMMWGEDLAIAGKKIMELLDGKEDYDEYTIYTSYGTKWLQNPGFKIAGISDKNKKYSEKDFYVLTKSALYRKKIPEFINVIEPIDTVEYNGEIAVWIYRGDQLKEYTSYFK